MDSDRVFRNHFSVILGNLFTVILLVGFVALGGLGRPDFVFTLAVSGCVVLIALLVLVHWWHRTTYTFTETGIEIDVDTVFKKHNSIPYAKLASVGVRRTLMNHLFGTSTLTFNVNSSMNANVAEGTLCLKRHLADDLRDRLNAMIFHKELTVQEDLGMETLVHVSNADILIHSFFGQSTWQQVFGTLMLAYSVFGVFAQNTGGVLVAFLMFLLSEGIPMVRVILKYFNYRVYRVGDTITVESGMVTSYRSSFKLNKVNSVRVYQPFLARLCGRSCLLAEVVGLAGDDGMPLLCPTKRTAEVRALMDRLIPEFSCESQGVPQPKAALYPMIILNGLVSAVVLTALVAGYTYASSAITETDMLAEAGLALLFLVPAILVPALLMGMVFLAQNHRQFAVGDRMCMVLHGAYDLSEEYINMDKVQYVTVRRTHLEGIFGLARMKVMMMSSMGTTTVESGLFRPEDLEKVGDRIMSRISDGSYDYRDYY